MGPFQITQYGTLSLKISSWYDEEAWLTSSEIPWVARSGILIGGTSSGIFYFTHAHGNAGYSYGFRLVLAF